MAGEMTASEPIEEAPRRISQIAPKRVRSFGGLHTSASAMEDVFASLSRLAQTDASILLLGETGVGKELLAKAIHRESARARRPFVVFDCGAVASTLAESELLGHERGAFTGARGTHLGAFERSHGGTLFLDEVGEMRMDVQPRLLRGLENRKIRRVGGRQERLVDVRVIAATNRDLRSEVAAGFFREDLYFRLAVAVVQVPPLRERLEDLPDLCRNILMDAGRPDLEVSDSAHSLLCDQNWPGNVRELKNAILCSAALLDPHESVLEADHMARVLWSRRDLDWAP
jgi:transcriptional regulator with GAF, ATPase, and Fis domain